MMIPHLMMLDRVGEGLSHPAMQQLGWVLVHFTWQGAVVAGLLAVALALVHRKHAQLRYALSLAALAILLVLPVATWVGLPSGGAPGGASATDLQATLQYLEAQHPETRATSEVGAEPVATSWTSALQSAIAVGLPWMVAGWLVGVLLLGGRQLGGWVYTIYLRRYHVRPVGNAWQQRIEALSARLEVRGPVRVRQSSIIDVPMVIGWLRPVVLVPVGVLTGLPPQQVDALIAHELSHIRRHDVLVGWIQGVAETLLFYHPAVWWISRQIRVEREHCCDDLAVAACRDQLTYAQALTTLATQQSARPVGTLAASDGSLLTRIRRLVEPANQTAKRDRMTTLLTLAVTITVLIVVGACASQRSASTDVTAAPGEPSTEAAPVAVRAEGPDSTDGPDRDEERTVVRVAPEGAGVTTSHQGRADSNGVVIVWTKNDAERLASRLDSLDRDIRIRIERTLAANDTIPFPPMPRAPWVVPGDSLSAAFPDVDVPDIAFDFHALDALDFPRAPVPPPAIYLDGDTIEFGAFRGPLVDSLRATLPHFRAFPDSLERSRIDSIRQRIEREMRVHQDEMRQFTEAHRERMERLQRELRERMMEEQPQRLRDQAEALRRQAERLEEQAREMERQRAPEADTSGTSGLRGTLPDTGPWAALRGGSHAVRGQTVGPDPVAIAQAEVHTEQPAQHARTDRQAVVWPIVRAAVEADPILAAGSVARLGRVPNLGVWLQDVERTRARSTLHRLTEPLHSGR